MAGSAADAPTRRGAPAAVVVNHDAGEALLACVGSLRAAGATQVVVVDNASSDGSLSRLAAADAAAVLVPAGRNLGYGRAANLGIARVRSEEVLVCNPDVVLDPGALDALSDVLAVAAGHALLGPLVPRNRWTRRYHSGARGAAPEEGRPTARGAGGAATGAGGDAVSEADWVSGACFLARTSALRSVGGFDEAYFMYAEDVDLCWRLRRAGWRVLHAPAARVVHYQGLSTSRHPYKMLVAHHRSAWRFARVSTSGPRKVLLPLVAAALAGRLAALLAREVARTRPPRRR